MVDLRDRTKAYVYVKREESLLLVTSYSTLVLKHIAIAPIFLIATSNRHSYK